MLIDTGIKLICVNNISYCDIDHVELNIKINKVYNLYSLYNSNIYYVYFDDSYQPYDAYSSLFKSIDEYRDEQINKIL